ncbi:hypothetical protein GTZ99_15705 [Novosphingobium sp. FSY-8]|uniref:Uncharacterized protein n=1 Tax=Novosphingobium ovatum TaxID=1908523 RepID=A0ABW9XHJ0_9SPHN|nr:hypothetical protein [Novosphingobium ovatum]NBC38000.1 hypothetical protein [Novosphingobium ovatum]
MAMELRFESDLWLRHTSGAKPDKPARPEWHELAMRLAAAHAFHRSVSRGDVATGNTGGSFHPDAARVMAGFAVGDTLSQAPSAAVSGVSAQSPEDQMSPAINPILLGDSKDTSGTDLRVAGAFPSGDRGLK